jgi:hypothetical protein
MNDHWRQGKLKPENARVLSQVARLTMSETVFWGALRFRIIRSGQLAALGYCDWLEVKRYCIGPPDARIEGRAGFVGRGPASKTYKFILVLPQQVESLDALDWQSLLPDPERPGWVKIEEGLITINAAAT